MTSFLTGNLNSPSSTKKSFRGTSFWMDVFSDINQFPLERVSPIHIWLITFAADSECFIFWGTLSSPCGRNSVKWKETISLFSDTNIRSEAIMDVNVIIFMAFYYIRCILCLSALFKSYSRHFWYFFTFLYRWRNVYCTHDSLLLKLV